jgi:hypothetical protein
MTGKLVVVVPHRNKYRKKLPEWQLFENQKLFLDIPQQSH